MMILLLFAGALVALAVALVASSIIAEREARRRAWRRIADARRALWEAKQY